MVQFQTAIAYVMARTYFCYREYANIKDSPVLLLFRMSYPEVRGLSVQEPIQHARTFVFGCHYLLSYRTQPEIPACPSIFNK